MGGDFATRPTDNWMAAVVMTNAAQFGYAIKAVEPVWRPRPLFNGRIAFMTAPTPDSPMRLAQADWGYIRTSPSSLADGEALPYEGGRNATSGPTATPRAVDLVAACPSPAPDGSVLFAGSPGGLAAGLVRDLRGLRRLDRRHARAPSCSSTTPTWSTPSRWRSIPRRFVPEPRRLTPPLGGGIHAGPRASGSRPGRLYTGPMGYLENVAMSTADPEPDPLARPIGRGTDRPARQPAGLAAAQRGLGRGLLGEPRPLRRSRPAPRPRLLGEADGAARGRATTTSGPGSPAIPSARRSSSGWTTDGKVARWAGEASGNRPARTYFAYAGDHYSGVRPERLSVLQRLPHRAHLHRPGSQGTDRRFGARNGHRPVSGGADP